MESLFRQLGIYSRVSFYEPVDKELPLLQRSQRRTNTLKRELLKLVLCHRLSVQETAYATHGLKHDAFLRLLFNVRPQRIGDLVWAAADMAAKGFLCEELDATTFAGEALY